MALALVLALKLKSLVLALASMVMALALALTLLALTPSPVVKRLKVKGLYSSLYAELQSVTCHMGSASGTCYPSQVNAPYLNFSHAIRRSICQPPRDGRLSCGGVVDVLGVLGEDGSGGGLELSHLSAQ